MFLVLKMLKVAAVGNYASLHAVPEPGIRDDEKSDPFIATGDEPQVALHLLRCSGR